MKFDRLRLNGFKSFVDPTDLLIREGLTGVVGPNGCGKSNLLEALRWVMGENRPSAMRGGGMEDVIFAGTSRRGARAHAEVTLTIDNRERLAPATVNDADGIDIVRRITRDAGSAYKINGKEARARDVQMLFADASTGAHSPALVRQGQISELINAKPKARRRILEEAAGISGLYARRHEAELKLNGAENNLTRVDDTLDQLATQAAALARQARAAAKYREIGAALRKAEGVLLYRRWAEADQAREAATEALRAAVTAAAEAEAAAKRATASREAAEAALPPLREEEQVAAALLSRATVDREALDDAEARAAAAIETLRGRVAQLGKDIDREGRLNKDAAEVVERLSWEKGELDKAGQGHDDRLDRAAKAADEAAEALREVEAKLAELTDESARLAAQAQSAERLVSDLTAMRDRAERAASEAEATADRADAAGAEAEASLKTAEAAQHSAVQLAESAEKALADAETDRSAAESAEAEARAARAEIEGEAGALRAEMAALEKLVARGSGDGGTLLDQVSVAKGYEAALGAALGDDLTMGPARDGSGWVELPGYDEGATLPDGTKALAAQVSAPELLTRRLSQIGVADAAQADAMQPALRPGQCLVSREGGLWRWDGMRIMPGEASSGAARHLEQVNRLTELRGVAEAASARVAEAVSAHDAAKARLAEVNSAEKAAREARREAERAVSDAARTATRAESDLAMARSRAESARAELTRHREDASDARARLAEAQRQLAALPDRAVAADAVEAAKTGVEAARIATMTRRSALDELRREGNARTRRLQEIAKEDSGWKLRLQEAGTRAAELNGRLEAAQAELTDAERQPALLAEKRDALQAVEAGAQARLDKARMALAEGDAALRQAQVEERDAERLASDSREARAAREARAEAARDTEAAARARILEDAESTPQQLLDSLGEADTDTPAARLEDQIARLRASRDALGAVNLRADEDKRELEEERAKLAGEKEDLEEAIRKLRAGIASLNREGRERLLAAFDTVNGNFTTLFTHLFGGGEAKLVLVESDDPLEAGLEIMCQPPGKKLSTLSLLSGGEQTLTALALIFAVFLANPAPICVLDEVDAPLDDANVSRFCDLLDEMTRRTETRFLIITHHAVTMARMDRLFGVTMVEQGVSQLVSVDLHRAEQLVA
ncbi:chromosome segregation SMC family protein [Paracoccus sediminicola]|uniref:chromosome segregation SMC family protein n=1 Tax=Paracoccus sediminicola TaxID=3017783 RepID=UPI0022F11F53|nr:AAA family ATPase [Paracoccus sediminicola]WBU57115.1 AAA family ATPase [Paracoccus sediminicola]